MRGDALLLQWRPCNNSAMSGTYSIRVADTPIADAGHVSEVAGVVHPGAARATVAWVRSSLTSEMVHLGRLEPSSAWTPLGQWTGFRPTLATIAGRMALAFLAPHEGQLAPVLSIDGGPPARLGPAGTYGQLSLAEHGGQLWVGWSVWVDGVCRVQIGCVGDEGRYTPVTETPGGYPELCAGPGRLRLAWADEKGLWVADVVEAGLAEAAEVMRLPQVEVPRLAVDDDGRWWTACHAPVADGVLRWTHVASQVRDGPWERRDPLIGHDQVPAQRASAGEDQGWEFPTIAVDVRRRLWLAGRSSQGFRLQVWVPDVGWSPRHDVAHTGWSGRSRSGCLLGFSAEPCYLRGSAQGLMLGQLALEGEQIGEAEPASHPPLRRPVPDPRPRLPADWQRPLWGDLHQHSIDSDGLGTVEDVYCRARDVYGHDFTALTDHGAFARREVGPVTWRHQCQIADAFYDPGRFVTLHAFEFTAPRKPGPGHKCVYFGDEVPEHLPSREVDELHELLRSSGGIAVPHHVGWTGADAQHHDPLLQPVWEICSVHGAYEFGGDQRIAPRPDVVMRDEFIDRALAAGLRFGFIGGSDSHGLRWHHGLARKPDPWRCGLAAVFAEPTREGVLAALRARRCYATSGAHIALRLQVDGAPMGSEIDGKEAELDVSVNPTAPLAKLSVIFNGEIVASERGDAAAHVTLRLPAATKPSYCYVRVEQQDGEMAWSSPVFINPV